jgi:hypothetical protein
MDRTMVVDPTNQGTLDEFGFEWATQNGGVAK